MLPSLPDPADAHHLLLVPDGVAPADLDALVRSRFPQAVAVDGAADLALEVLPGCVVDGPWAPAGAQLPPWAAAGYRLRAPVQRGPAVPPELQGRGDLLDAFADGEPVAEERQLLELGLAVARRVGGAVRTSGPDGMTLAPPGRPDLLIYSEVWLHPDALVHVLEPHLPGIAVEGEPTPGSIPPDAVTQPSLIEDEGERRWLHAEADAYDAAALAEPAVTEAYGALTTRGGATYAVTVEAAAGVPLVLADLDWAGLILYEIRCYAEQPPADAVERVDAAARAILAAAGGHVVDDDGFLVDLGPAT